MKSYSLGCPEAQWAVTPKDHSVSKGTRNNLEEGEPYRDHVMSPPVKTMPLEHRDTGTTRPKPSTAFAHHPVSSLRCLGESTHTAVRCERTLPWAPTTNMQEDLLYSPASLNQQFKLISQLQLLRSS